MSEDCGYDLECSCTNTTDLWKKTYEMLSYIESDAGENWDF